MDALQFPDPQQRRRPYSAAFKAQLIAACLPPGISIASMVIANQVNSSLLQRWVLGYQRKKSAPASITPETPPAFIPVEITPLAASEGNIKKASKMLAKTVLLAIYAQRESSRLRDIRGCDLGQSQ